MLTLLSGQSVVVRSDKCYYIVCVRVYVRCGTLGYAEYYSLLFVMRHVYVVPSDNSIQKKLMISVIWKSWTKCV